MEWCHNRLSLTSRGSLWSLGASLAAVGGKFATDGAPIFTDSFVRCSPMSVVLCADKAMPPRIMYIEDKSNGLSGPGRIGRVRFSKSGKSIYYGKRTLRTLGGSGFKANYFDVETGAEFWVSGCKKRGGDRLYGGVIEIDDDVREEYWVVIRGMPQNKDQRVCRG